MSVSKPQVDVGRGKKQPVPKVVEVTVTAEVIANAVRGDSAHCIASDAINATITGARASTDLGTTTLTLREHGIRVAYLTPPIIQQMLVDFDNGERIKPFRFALRRVDAIQVRRYRPRDKATGKQPTAALPGATTPGKRTTVKAGEHRTATTGQSRIPPVGVLANRKGRMRRYGSRQLETQKAETAARIAAEEAAE